jgi:hypothetical protein
MLMLSGSGTIRYLNAKEVEKGPSLSSRAVACIIIGRVVIFPAIGEGGCD